MTDPNALLQKPLKEVKQSTQYFDGLGRALQTVVKNGSLVTNPADPANSSTATDLVSPVVYDAFGREQFKYLPYAASGNDGTQNNGQFKLNPFQQQVAFYNNQLIGQAGETNTGANNLNWAYGKINYEASPLNRVMESFSPGVNWVGSENAANSHATKMQYFSNTSADGVRIWDLTETGIGIFGSYNSSNRYPDGALYKTITTDEHGKQVIEFKDKTGLLILKKVQIGNTTDNGNGCNHTDWLCTYYIYDDLHNLRCVVQPEGVKFIEQQGWSLTDPTILAEQCFLYAYDARNRMILKKVPGAGEVFMIYDKRDRLVLTQDANMRAASKWLFTKYDQLNRPIMTGLYLNSTATGQANMQNYLNSQNMALYENYQIANFPLYSLANSFPVIAYGDILTITYYDDYSWVDWYGFPKLKNRPTTLDGYLLPSGTDEYPYAQPIEASSQVRAMPTGIWDVTGRGMLSEYFYDSKGRVIQTEKYSYIDGRDALITQYNWAGQPLLTIQKQEKTGANAQTTTILTRLSYDDLGRLIKTEKKIANTLVNNGLMPADYKVIASMEYDALGRLKKKILAPAFNNNAGLETQHFEYNIRGWMLGMNRDYARDGNNNNYFGFDLGYDKTNNNLIGSQSYNQAQYNGNIAGMVWKGRGDSEKRRYDFTYDAANRLLNADFNQYANNSFTKEAAVDFSVKMGDGINPGSAYDANGNIKNMQQWGLKLNSSPQIDNLSYQYQNKSNKLEKVTDANAVDNKLGDFKDGSNGDNVDYGYDGNGNMNFDHNKNIPDINYNHLNLPLVIQVTNKGSIEYRYDAYGNKKLKKVVDRTTSTEKITNTLYLDGLVYQNDTLQLISQEEGRIRFKPAVDGQVASLQYDYFIKDHLGNVRAVLTEEPEQNIYPAATLE
jgi:hypothetical protein